MPWSKSCGALPISPLLGDSGQLLPSDFQSVPIFRSHAPDLFKADADKFEQIAPVPDDCCCAERLFGGRRRGGAREMRPKRRPHDCYASDAAARF